MKYLLILLFLDNFVTKSKKMGIYYLNLIKKINSYSYWLYYNYYIYYKILLSFLKSLYFFGKWFLSLGKPL